MKRMKRQILAMLLAALTVAGLFGSMTAEAAVPKLYTTEMTCYVMNPLMSYVEDIEGVKSTSQITNLKSSNPSVATVSKEKMSGSENASIVVLAKKAGKTVVSFTVKYGTGLKKSKKLKLNVTVKKYTNPCKSFKIGTKEYASYFKSTTFGFAKGSGKTLKVSVKARSGWKLDHLYVRSSRGETKDIKNNSKLNTKTYPSVYAQFVNKKTGDYLSTGMIFE